MNVGFLSSVSSDLKSFHAEIYNDKRVGGFFRNHAGRDPAAAVCLRSVLRLDSTKTAKRTTAMAH